MELVQDLPEYTQRDRFGSVGFSSALLVWHAVLQHF